MKWVWPGRLVTEMVASAFHGLDGVADQVVPDLVEFAGDAGDDGGGQEDLGG
ncbi:MAG: hypothetical protein HC860_23110 [Alkalinema sp. RU_4_3]|nr:hypothetical protein [Alkalinema sp. RU_4_3]